MTALELLDLLKKRAIEFRSDSDYYKRNSHMHQCINAPDKSQIDAVLVGFINTVAMSMGVDYGLYSTDISIEENDKK